MRVVIDVTEQDIEDAEAWRDDPEKSKAFVWGQMCPIARAATRAFSRPMTAGFARLFDSSSSISAASVCHLPEEASDLIYRFDLYRPVSPISFEVEVIE